MSDFDEPTNLVERAGDAGIQAITEYLAHADAKIESLIILLSIDSAPLGEPDTVTCGSGLGEPRNLVAHLGAHFVQAAEAVGLKVQLVPMQQSPPEG